MHGRVGSPGVGGRGDWNAWEVGAAIVFTGGLGWLSWIDARTKRLPRRLIYATAAGVAPLLAVAALAARHEPRRLAWMAVCAAASVAVLLLMYAVSRGGFGDGDVRLGGVIGLTLGYFGWRVAAMGLTLGFMAGAFGGLVAVAMRRATLRSPIPFGPFMAAGAVVALAFQSALR